MVIVSHLFPFYGNILPNYSYFNPCLHEGGDALLLSAFRLKNNFNPRLREGGDKRIIDGKKTFDISIHASEKEATLRHLEKR